MFAGYFVPPKDLWTLIGTARAPTILDVRRREVYDAARGLIPTAVWGQPENFAERVPALSGERPIVVACRDGDQSSQMGAADLRQRGLAAQVREGGYRAWTEAGLHAVSLGLSALAADNDQGLLERGFAVYDALFAWTRFAAAERHYWAAKAA